MMENDEQVRATEGQAQTSAAVEHDPECGNSGCTGCIDPGVLAAQLADSTAPGAPEVAWQHRYRITPYAEWSDWRECDKEQHDMIQHATQREMKVDKPHITQEARALYAAPTAQQSLTAGGAVPDLSAANWAPVFHTAFRVSGSSRAAQAAHSAIERMSDAEWLGIVDYVLIGLRRSFFAAPLPQVQSEPDDGEVMCEECGLLRGESRLLSAIGDAKREAQRSADQQPVTPSGALADNDGGVK